MSVVINNEFMVNICKIISSLGSVIYIIFVNDGVVIWYCIYVFEIDVWCMLWIVFYCCLDVKIYF